MKLAYFDLRFGFNASRILMNLLNISAPPGYFLKLDFRDRFDIEPSQECRYVQPHNTKPQQTSTLKMVYFVKKKKDNKYQ